jgi:hypothetical protein
LDSQLMFQRRCSSCFYAVASPVVGGPICASHKKGSGRWALRWALASRILPSSESCARCGPRPARGDRSDPENSRSSERWRTEGKLPPSHIFPSRLILFLQVATRVEGKPRQEVQTPRATLVARRATTGGRCRSFGGRLRYWGGYAIRTY